MSAGPGRENDDADAQITDSCSRSSPPHPFSSLLVPACFPGTFKSKLGDGSCGPCPANSHSSARGASICPCQSGFHRADSDPPESVCTSKSSSGRKQQRSLRAWLPLDSMMERWRSHRPPFSGSSLSRSAGRQLFLVEQPVKRCRAPPAQSRAMEAGSCSRCAVLC